SLLTARLSVYDSAGRPVRSTSATDPLHNDLTVRLEGANAGETYFVKVTGDTNDMFGIGAYHLAVQPLCSVPGSSQNVALYGGTSTAVPPLGLADEIKLLATTPGYVEHTYYETSDRLSPATPVHTYRVRSADVGPDRVNVMTVVAYSPDTTARFQVAVYDEQG